MDQRQGDQERILPSDLFSIAGKVAVITGGSRGIGLMIARGFAESGARLYISSRKKEVCDRTAEDLSRYGTCTSISADLSCAEGVNRLFETVSARESALQILVNNAGATWNAPLDQHSASAWDRVCNLNVKGLFLITQKFIPLLEKGSSPNDPSRVINIGSIDGLRVPAFDTYAYSAAKAAVHHMTKVLAYRLGKRGITVNAIAPGPFKTKMTAGVLEQVLQDILAACPLGRIGTPQDIAGLAVFLSSRASAYLSGAIIPLDGGIVTGPW